MLQRKPRKGDRLEHTTSAPPLHDWKPLGTVTHCDGNICWYRYHDRDDSGCFIWWFERDKSFNKLTRIIEAV